MAILEVGRNKTYKSISAAINDAADGDEIKIYPAFYNETFDCDKDLIFTGVPSDIKDFSTYPQIYNGEEEMYTRITGKCSFCNLIFMELYCEELKELQESLNGETLSDELIQKYYREEIEESHLEVFCLAVESESVFENCHFIGARNYGIVVDLKNTKNAPRFSDCGFYLNYYSGIYVTGKKADSAVFFQNCKIAYNGNGIYGGNFYLKNCELHHNQANGVLFCAEESKIEHCDIFQNGCGIAGDEKGSLFIYESDIHTNFSEGINLGGSSKIIVSESRIMNNSECELFVTDSSKCEVEKSHFITKQLSENHKKNERAVAVMCVGKTESRFNECEFRSQKTKDTVLAILMRESQGHFTDCTFKEAENGIVVYNQSGCEIKHCRFLGCLNLDIFQKSKLTSWVDFYDTELSEATKKDLSIKDYEIARKLLPELNDEDRKIISMYYNLDSKNPEEEYRLTGEEVALYFNIPVKRVERAFNRLAELAEE